MIDNNTKPPSVVQQDRSNNRDFTDLNPYKGCAAIPMGSRRLNCDIATEDFEFIRSIRSGLQGTTTVTANLLWSKLVKALKDRGITSYVEFKQFEDFLKACVITLPDDNGQTAFESGHAIGYAAGLADAKKRKTKKVEVQDGQS